MDIRLKAQPGIAGDSGKKLLLSYEAAAYSALELLTIFNSECACEVRFRAVSCACFKFHALINHRHIQAKLAACFSRYLSWASVTLFACKACADGIWPPQINYDANKPAGAGPSGHSLVQR